VTEMISVTRVEPLEGHWLRVSFSDGSVKEVDLGELLSRGGVFAAIRDNRDLFEQVRLKPNSRTVEWPGEIDLDPDVLYGTHEPASGARISRRVVRAPAHA
jgi:hypothetical protein